ncbi:MAG: putative nucleotide-binding protein containing TIR-like protein [Herminiimonas sp.]|nr:putative nucleotide-binding protein containing TIR-like protein [Herminiimonas sp.]
MKPKLFIGSSVEGLKLAHASQQNLRRAAEVTVWDQGIFGLSSTVLESLIEALNRSDFGLFIFSPDDVAVIRGKESSVVRDNVIFELGLFIGKLGKRRCFFMIPEDAEDIHLPSDLVGIQPAGYETGRSDNNLQAATAASCHQIRDAITKLGPSSYASTTGAEALQVAASNKSAFTEEQEVINSSGTQSSIAAMEDGSPAIILSNISETANEDKPSQVRAEEGENTNISDSDWFKAFIDDRNDEALRLLQAEIDAETEPEKIAEMRGISAAVKQMSGASDWEDDFKRVLADYPDLKAPQVSFVRRYINAEMPDAAFALIDDIEKKFEATAEASMLRAEVFGDLGQDDAAVSVLEIGIQTEPNNVDLYLALGRKYKKMEQSAKAIGTFHKALKVCSKKTELLEEFASLLSDENKNEATLNLYQRLLTIEPKNSRFTTLFGNTCLQLDLYDMAMSKYEKANELTEWKEAWILGNIGNLYVYRGFFTKGIEYLNKALDIDKNSQYAHERLASALKQKEAQTKRYEELLILGRKEIAQIGQIENQSQLSKE